MRLPPSIVLVLESIRRDEGRHVRAARRLVEEFSIDASANRSIELETRYAFDAVLGGYDMAFAALNVDVNAMRCQIRRDNS